MPPQPIGAFVKNPPVTLPKDSAVIIVLIQGTPGTFMDGAIAGSTVKQIHEALVIALQAEGARTDRNLWEIAAYIKGLDDAGLLTGSDSRVIYANAEEWNGRTIDRALFYWDTLDMMLPPIVGMPWEADYSREPLPTDPWYTHRGGTDDYESDPAQEGRGGGGGGTVSPPPTDDGYDPYTGEPKHSHGCYEDGEWNESDSNPELEDQECPAKDEPKDAGSKITAESEYGRVWGFTVEVCTMPESDFLLFQTGSSMCFIRYAG